MVTPYDDPSYLPDFSIKLNDAKIIQTVFIANNEFGNPENSRPMKIAVGSLEYGECIDHENGYYVEECPDFESFSSCVVDDIVDGGFYRCTEPLIGNYLSIYRTENWFLTEEEYPLFSLHTVRAYEGVNVAELATVIDEPVYEESAQVLSRQYPRTGRIDRYPNLNSENPTSTATDTSLKTCSWHTDLAE